MGFHAWTFEPDSFDFLDEASRLPCAIRRMPTSLHLCGYVGLPEGHPLVGMDEEADAVRQLNVHGSVTYAEAELQVLSPYPAAWWLGFHCGNTADLMPGHQLLMFRNSGLKDCEELFKFLPPGRYCDISYVKTECQELAKQLT